MGIAIVVAAVVSRARKRSRSIVDPPGLDGRLLASPRCLPRSASRTGARSSPRSAAPTPTRIQEWQPTPGPRSTWPSGAWRCCWPSLTVRRWKSLERPADRVLVVAALVAFPLAARSLRNVPAFMMIAAPAISRLLYTLERLVAAGLQARDRRQPFARKTSPRRRCPDRWHGRRRRGVAPTVAAARMAAHRRARGGSDRRLHGTALQHVRKRRPDHLVRAFAAGVHRQPAGSVSDLVRAGGDRRRSDRRLRGTVQPVAHQLRGAASRLADGSPPCAGRMADAVQRSTVDGVRAAARSDHTSHTIAGAMSCTCSSPSAGATSGSQ